MPTIQNFLESVHPYSGLSSETCERVAGSVLRLDLASGSPVYRHGERLSGLYLVMAGRVETRDATGALISELSRGDHFGERGLLSGGAAATSANVLEDAALLLLPAETFHALMLQEPGFARFFARNGVDAALPRPVDFTARKVGDLMSAPPVVCQPSDTVRQAAAIMRDSKVSCLGVVDDERLLGILTVRDLATRVVAVGLSPETTPVSAVMTPDPTVLSVSDLGTDILHLMLERGIGHLPVVDGARLVGVVTQTDLTRFQALSAAHLIRDIASATRIDDLRAATAAIPALLVQLVGGHHPHEVVTRLITDIADAVTRRLIALAEERLGPSPVPYLWLACGSQGRQEQTGVSDQDNCIVIDNAFEEVHRPWFEALARFVSDGLDACGYVYCPGDMMATNPRWCQPVSVWRGYFRDWITTPDPTAQMLASVMFDLRPIAGPVALFAGIQAETLAISAGNPFFVGHMVGNALTHVPPLGLLRGLVTLKSGEHRNQIDMKMNGVVPVVDLARIYALNGQLTPVNTRARLKAAGEAGVISIGEARDLVAAYDFVAESRLRHQAALARSGKRPDHYLNPHDLGEFERAQLRDAFVVIRTMQAALAHRGALPL